jgi:hypothetical protein
MACAVEVSPNDVDVEIGCHPGESMERGIVFI